jgi:predicted amidophosphoribosyltransferase
MFIVIMSVLLGLLVLSCKKIKTSPDPWSDILSVDELEKLDHALCTKCQSPVASPRQHYCPSCGNVTGEFTGYIPFVSIPFSCSLYETLWTKLKTKDGPIIGRLFACLMLLCFAPLILIVGIPIQCYLRIKSFGRPDNSEKNG